MKSVTCENCTTNVRDTPENLRNWITVGWHRDYQSDACSPACAKAIIDLMDADDKEGQRNA